MRLLTYTVAPEQEGWPLRRLLRQELRISGSFLSRLKWRPGAILLNGQPATVAALVRAGDTVTANVSDLPGDNPHIRPVDYPLDILWEDQDLLILNKPAGIAIHPAALTEETVTVAGAGPGAAAADSRHRPHPPAAAAPVRHWPPAAGGLALRPGGPGPDPPSGPALPPAGDDPPRHPPPPDGNGPAAGGYGPASAGRYEQILKNAKKGWKF